MFGTLPRRVHLGPTDGGRRFWQSEGDNMTKVLRFLDSSGDREIRFDDSEEMAQVRAEAQRLFESAMASGAVAFGVNRSGGEPDRKVGDFSALENETVVVPRVVGG